jgi:hypothetical protein
VAEAVDGPIGDHHTGSTAEAGAGSRAMRRRQRWSVTLLGLLLAAVLAVAAFAGRHEQRHVYSVAQVRAGLVDHPQAWVGQTVQVRGVAWPCLGRATGPCLVRSPILTDPEADAGLAFAPQRANLLLAFIRTVPLVGKLLPPGQRLHWGELASHRVQIRDVPLVSCTYWPCYEVVLVDAAR